jgi:GABA(A) receptor-associated protein
MVKHKDEFLFEERKQESQKLINIWPDKVPIFAERSRNSRLEELDKQKMLCPENHRFSQFIACLRAKLNLNARQSLFIFINKKIITSDLTMRKVYEDNKDEDGFLYLEYCEHEYLG